MKSVAIITARGGSKRIHKKNIKLFCGKPIIEYSIKASLDAGIFDEVMVSTDESEIAEVALNAGASVPFMRSAETSDDFATTSDVVTEVINRYSESGSCFDYGCCIYPTAPFVTPEKLRHGMELLQTENADTVVPVVAFSFPPQRGYRIINNRVQLMHTEYRNARSQDLETIYHDCGQFYCFNVERFLKSGKIVGDDALPIIMEETEVQDIDNLTDWKIAEMKYKIMMEDKNGEV